MKNWFKKLLAKLSVKFFPVLALSLTLWGQAANRQFSASAAPVADSVTINEGGAVSFHQLSWVPNGTVSTCQVKVEQSPDNSTWSDLIAAQTCTSAGKSIITAANNNFVRINFTTLSGTGTVTATYLGFYTATGGPSVATGSSFTGSNPYVIGAVDPSGNVAPVRCSAAGGTGNGCAISIGTLAGVGDGMAGNTLVGPIPGASGSPSATGLVTFQTWYNGSTIDISFYCKKTAKLNALGAATTQIVALQAAQKIRICSAVVSNNNATATTMKFVEGTGANCGSGTADVSALMNFGATSTVPTFLNWGNYGALQTATSGDALCVTGGAAGSLEITITYEQH